MVKVDFLGPINVDSVEINIKSLNELSEYMLSDSRLKEWVNNSAIAINDNLISNKNVELKSGDVISVLPPVCGG